MRSIKSFSRGVAKYKPSPTTLIVCEDSRSGKTYLEDAAHFFRVDAKVLVAHCGYTNPSGIVDFAISKLSKFDRVYCVIDRDEHPCFNKALVTAAQHPKITMIKSYPCFEFWLLLHFGYSRKPFSRTGKFSAGDNVGRELRTHQLMDRYDKGASQGVFNTLLGKPFEDAQRFAPRVLLDAESSQAPNPSTELHLLIDDLKKLGGLQPVD
ncbi:TPA: RloB family protein [Pseudomonas aeruginosa]|uniref:RloB family protein n=1 Tax=Pseudomonas aeruginosa TaxID=287 RepID=UPI0009A9475C|nr:RloB family protein [Pseudomonas aeruginosa]MBI8355726.1 RloB domain-containing protein [Pseudomonas aeruginosa]MEC6379702.1 RloB family protein [Pseudomonas aeruginosa]MWW52254.1 RloB domain-containing protein [Pseudomonas aeruginosa]HEJ1244823.1 RloB domain-containing protein [Pseudomonas aeruginosa]HEJ1246600.1 RloB domain-containing protein [Pseudomonas aeruginosa]